MDKQNVRLDTHLETGKKKLRVLGKYGHGHGSNPPTVSTYVLAATTEASSSKRCEYAP